ncbi:MAG: hypothetical protein L6Q81_04590 [Bacteroidia bacterium]|nr:hypothetical protein [Bacteroidia bacterium]
MKLASMFLFAIVALFSCSESNVQKRSYTETDVEGYWATSSAINQAIWTDALKEYSGNFNTLDFLRLYNNACCRPDTIFTVREDTLYLQCFSLENRDYELKPQFKILFLSFDRMVLLHLATREEITYYSLASIPSSMDSLKKIKFYDRESSEWCLLTGDSIHFALQDEVLICRHPPTMYHEKQCSEWYSRLAGLYSKLTSEEILFAKSRKLAIYESADSEFRQVAYFPSFTLEISGSRGLERVDDCGNTVNPVLAALYWEVAAAMRSHNKEQ